MLAFGPMRLLPGTYVDVHVVTHRGRVLVRSFVVRARVCRVSAGEIQYVGALTFDRRVDTAPPGYGLPIHSASAAAGEGKAYPNPHEVPGNCPPTARDASDFTNDHQVAPPLE